MRTEDVRRLAVECDLDPHDLCEDPRIALHNLARFAALVASTEREACAQVCQERAEECEREAQIAGAAHEHDAAISLRATAWQLTVCAKRIRAMFEAGRSAAPAGWRLVPAEPTEEMIAAMESQWMCSAQADMAKREYKAALAAAPEVKS